MFALIITSGPGKGKKLELNGKNVYVIGKNSDCDLVLTNSAVAWQQVRLTVLTEGKIRLEKCDDEGVVYVNDKFFDNPLFIMPGDIIRIQDCLIQLYNIGGSEQVASHCIPGNYHTIPGGRYEPVTLHKKMLELGSQTITIGRDQSNDIVLSHPLVSRKHAKITAINGYYVIDDLSSTNGTFVNSVLVTKQMVVPPKALIVIGGFRLLFDNGKLAEYDDNDGQIRMEIRNLSRKIVSLGKQERTLLDNISLTIEPREFVAILGGSGTGKSTLLGALTGMSRADSGTVMVNGLDMYKEYVMVKSIIGYVPQDDIVHQELTVNEVLTYSAKLRMPDDSDEAQINQIVEMVLNDLELTLHRNTIVRELSGGQRKRVSIGVEMLTQPSLFFLDEPTSGLDPGLERVMMELLRKLAKQGRTIILVTHATCNIGFCDKVIFLARGGKLAFHGTPDEALRYFNCDDFAEIYNRLESTKTPSEWEITYAQSSLRQKYGGRGGNYSDVSAKSSATSVVKPIARHSAFKQWRTLTARYVKIICRNRKNVMVLLAQAIIIPAIIAAVFNYASPVFEYSQYKAGDLKLTQAVVVAGKMGEITQKAAAENQRYSIMIQCVSMMLYTAILLGASNSAREIVKELTIYRRERLANLRIHPYLLSKVTVLTVICFIQALMLVAIIDFGLGLPNFGLNLLAFFLVYVASMMMGLTLSAFVANADEAGTAIILLLIPQIILSGTIVPMSQVKPAIFQAVYYLAISKWALGLVGGGIIDINSRLAPDLVRGKLLTELSSVNVTVNWAVLCLFVLLLYIGAFYAIRRRDKIAER